MEKIAGLLHVEDVALSFGGLAALKNFNLILPAQALHGLIGPNGAGKTTAFNVLTGIYAPDQGTLRLGGDSLLGKKPFEVTRMGLARTFQNIRLFQNLSVLDNVRMAFHQRGTETLLRVIARPQKFYDEEANITQQSLDLLKFFNLENRCDDLAKNLPYGDQRRLEMARALATQPKVLLLDEPAAGMNSGEKKTLAQLIQTVRKTFNVAILLIEHDMGLVMDICEHITVLDYGVVIAEDSPKNIQKNAKVIEAYLGIEET